MNKIEQIEICEKCKIKDTCSNRILVHIEKCKVNDCDYYCEAIDGEKQIEEMAKVVLDYKFSVKSEDFSYKDMCKAILNAGYRNCKDKMVLDKEEYEKLKSLYDCQNGAYMTSSIGDLPLTVEGLRKAVDEITRLINVQIELQELNAEYYNDAKDLRRELRQSSKLKAETIRLVKQETAREIISKMKKYRFHKGLLTIEYEMLVNDLAKQYGVEVE